MKVFIHSDFGSDINILTKKEAKKLAQIVDDLFNQRITSQYKNHPLKDANGLQDLHISDNVILMYKYDDEKDILDIILRLVNISNHDELQKKINNFKASKNYKGEFKSLEEDKLEVKDIEKMAELKDGDKVVVDKNMEKVFDKADEMTKEFGLEEEPKLETFEEQMDFLAKDEQEAIDGYEKVIALVEDEHVKEQLEKILIEEKAHKDFLEKVKEDKELVYEEPLPVEEPKEEEVEVVDEVELKEETKTPLKDLKISKYKYLLDVYDTEDNFIERKFFRSRPEADRFVDAMTDLYDIKISNNELVELENGKDFMGTYWKVIRNINKEEPIKEGLKESFGKDISDEEIKEIMSSYEYLDEVDLDDIVLECTDLHITRNKLDIDTYSEEWDNIWDKYNKRVYELAKDFRHEDESEDDEHDDLDEDLKEKEIEEETIKECDKQDEKEKQIKESVEDEEEYDDVSWLKSLDEPEYNVDYKEEETSMQNKITANMFDDEDDYVPTEEDIKENMEFFDTIGKQEG